MCLFPQPNTNYRGIAYKKGLKEYECGKCPECLGKRSSAWALRAVMQARESKNCCMVTLTYDTFKRDNEGDPWFCHTRQKLYILSALLDRDNRNKSVTV